MQRPNTPSPASATVIESGSERRDAASEFSVVNHDQLVSHAPVADSDVAAPNYQDFVRLLFQAIAISGGTELGIRLTTLLSSFRRSVGEQDWSRLVKAGAEELLAPISADESSTST